VSGAPEPVIRRLSPREPLAERALRAYMEEMVSRYHGGPATDADVSLALEEFPTSDLEPPEGLFVVAVAGDEALACGGLQLLDGASAEVKRVWVAPSARRLGLGTRVMAELERLALEHGRTRVRLDTRADLVEARGLYARLGYAEVPPFGANPYAAHWFEKRLA
jgi:ribosomal protein S18 acetylase RimI-like enzyme